jgi:predicted CXXCH cytochrome family protein
MTRARWLLGLGLVACVAGGPAGWLVSDALEANNDFCTSCHLDSKTPLHAHKRRDFEAAPATSLVAAHHAAKAEFRCIDCHGGASFPNKLRVKTVAARDAVQYVFGSFQEPEDMEFPLWNEDCTKCHATWKPERTDAFHAIGVHNLPAFEFDCVQCHRAHPTGRDAALDFLASDDVLPVCRNCHEEF